MGPLPASKDAAGEIERLEQYQRLLLRLNRPATDEEARVLLRVLGPDDCFGLSWAIIHLVESAPGWPLLEEVKQLDDKWLRVLADRATRART